MSARVRRPPERSAAERTAQEQPRYNFPTNLAQPQPRHVPARPENQRGLGSGRLAAGACEIGNLDLDEPCAEAFGFYEDLGIEDRASRVANRDLPQERRAVHVDVVEVADREAEERAEEAAVHARDERPVEIVVRARARVSRDDVGLRGQGEVAADRVRIHREVRRHEDEELAPSRAHRGGDSRADAPVHRMPHQPNTRVARSHRLGERSSRIGAPVIDDDDLERDAEAFQRRNELADGRLELPGFVVRGHADGHDGCIILRRIRHRAASIRHRTALKSNPPAPSGRGFWGDSWQDIARVWCATNRTLLARRCEPRASRPRLMAPSIAGGSGSPVPDATPAAGPACAAARRAIRPVGRAALDRRIAAAPVGARRFSVRARRLCDHPILEALGLSDLLLHGRSIRAHHRRAAHPQSFPRRGRASLPALFPERGSVVPGAADLAPRRDGRSLRQVDRGRPRHGRRRHRGRCGRGRDHVEDRVPKPALVDGAALSRDDARFLPPLANDVETVFMVSFFACFLLFYLLYRTRSPWFLYPAILFGGIAFYSYSVGQVVMAAASGLLLLVDLPYHVRKWRFVLPGLVLIAVVAFPLLRFRHDEPNAARGQLSRVSSYWLSNAPIQEKAKHYGQEWLAGLSPHVLVLPDDDRLDPSSHGRLRSDPDGGASPRGDRFRALPLADPEGAVSRRPGLRARSPGRSGARRDCHHADAFLRSARDDSGRSRRLAAVRADRAASRPMGGRRRALPAALRVIHGAARRCAPQRAALVSRLWPVRAAMGSEADFRGRAEISAGGSPDEDCRCLPTGRTAPISILIFSSRWARRTPRAFSWEACTMPRREASRTSRTPFS